MQTCQQSLEQVNGVSATAKGHLHQLVADAGQIKSPCSISHVDGGIHFSPDRYVYVESAQLTSRRLETFFAAANRRNGLLAR